MSEEANVTPDVEESRAARPIGRGGHRVGSGRKREGYLHKTRGDVAYARSLIHTLMKDEAQPMILRARCALAVLRLEARTPKPGRKSISGKR